ncbi:MAG: hypothetical protein KGS45_02185 [Planctomycetes bacterium]|nr:hypothetical protein [Planctomycetota bacterium]
MRLAHSTLIALASGSLCSIAPGQVLSWANSSGGFASTPTNWSPAQMPSASSQLQFNLSNTFTVTYTSNAPSSLSHVYKRGTVSLISTTPHTTGSMIVADLAADTAITKVTSGTFTSNGNITVGDASTSNGTLEVSGTQTTLTIAAGADALIGNAGNATLRVLGGGHFNVGDQFLAGSNSTSTVNVLISGEVNGRSSTLDVQGISDSRIGAGGDVSMVIDERGRVNFGGNLIVANGAASASSITVRANGGGSSQLSIDGSLSLGRNVSTAAAGSGSLIVEQGGVVNVNDVINLGNDPEGGTGLIRLANENALIRCNGLNIGIGGALDIQHGIFSVLNNPVTAPSGFVLNISGPAPTNGTLWLRNGSAYTATNTTVLGQAPNTGGTLLLDGGSTFIQSTGALLIGLDTGSIGEFYMYNSSFTVDTVMRVGVAGTVSVVLDDQTTGTVRDLEVGTTASADAHIIIAESTLTVLDDCVFGGSPTGGGGFATGGNGDLFINSNAVLNTSPSKPLVVTPTGGIQCVDATINSPGGILARGPVHLGGVVNASLVELYASATAQRTINARIINTIPLTLNGDLVAGNISNNAIDRTQFAVGPHQLDLRDGSVAVLGNTSIAGGSINANTSLEVHSTATISGFGTIIPDINVFGTLAPSGTSGLTFNGQVAAADRTFTGTRLHFAGTSSFLGWNIDSATRLHTDPGSIISLSGASTIGTNTSDGIILGGELDVSGFIDLVDSDTIALGTRTTLRNASLLITCPFSTLGRTGSTPHILRGTGIYHSSLRSSGVISPGLDETDRTGTLSPQLLQPVSEQSNRRTGHRCRWPQRWNLRCPQSHGWRQPERHPPPSHQLFTEQWRHRPLHDRRRRLHLRRCLLQSDRSARMVFAIFRRWC